MYLQGRWTVPSMSPKTDGRLSTMTTQDEAGNIRAFPSGPRLQRSGARKIRELWLTVFSRTDSAKGQWKAWTAISVIAYSVSFLFLFSEKERKRDAEYANSLPETWSSRCVRDSTPKSVMQSFVNCQPPFRMVSNSWPGLFERWVTLSSGKSPISG